MSIASEITRISGNIADAYTALGEKGATLPAAGSQNSGNLADTIATVSTGGGGYDSFRSMVAGITLGQTCKDAYDSGDWYVIDYYKTSSNAIVGDSSTSSMREGYFFGYEEAPDVIYVQTSNPVLHGVMVPENTDVDEITTSPYSITSPLLKIDYTNASEKWLVVPNVGITNGLFTIHESAAAAQANAIDYFGIFSTVKYYCAYLNNTSYTESSPKTVVFSSESGQIASFNWICDYSSILEDFDIDPALKFTLLDDSKDMFYIPTYFIPESRIVDVEKICSHFTNVTYGTTAFTGQKTNSTLYYYANRLARCKKFPFVLDGSGISASSNTWYIGSPKSSGTSYSSDYPIWWVPEELFIIAPNMNINWTATDHTGNYAANKISIRSLKFLANNSPNVSNRTLTIGATNIYAANEADPTIITTLQSKGWTVQ